MSSTLMIPVHLDALFLATAHPVLEPMVNFTRLPYFDGTKDVNGDTAYISEEIVRQPLQDQGLYLKAGIHLHWSLPDALTKGLHTAGKTVFPAVPNRWLVLRKGQNVVEKKWIVESDYLYPDGAGGQIGSVNFPVAPDPTSRKRRPFRFLGRSMPFAVWEADKAPAEYLDTLTAVGYGEPSFAAFYPNCHSVFGFHDDEFAAGPPVGLQYDVIGWYSDPDKDGVRKLSGGLTNKAGDARELLESLAKEFKWTVSLGGDKEFPTRMICYARLTFSQNADFKTSPSVNAASPAITVANTGTEALSAYLANVLANSNPEAEHTQDSNQASLLKSNIENQLEALSFSSRLENRQLDVGPKFEEARHEKGFTAISGGTLWSIAPQALRILPADANNASAQSQICLPEGIAHQLNTLNTLQQEFDGALQEIESRRRQLFSDWYKYLLCAYPPEDARDDYPNIDEVRNYIEVNGLRRLQRKVAATGEWPPQAGNGGGKSSVNSSAEPLAFRLAAAFNQLSESVTAFNETESVKQANVVYQLKAVPGPRYYRPNDPVVLLTGPVVKPTLRHGRDGRLRDDGLLECQLLEDGKSERPIPAILGAITTRLDEIEKDGDDSIAFSKWTQQPWNPFLLEWEVEVFPIQDQNNLQPDMGGYLPGFIDGNYILDEDAVDFSVRSGKGSITKAANVYTGTSILTPHAGVQLKTRIEAYLREQLLHDYYMAQNVPVRERTEDYFSKHITEVLSWYKEPERMRALDAALRNIIRAYDRLTANNFYSLSQSLGGFNDALLMHKQTLQLDVADPLGFDDYQSFADEVRAAVRKSMTSAPQPLSDFNPIRSGALKLIRLRLVDTFGQMLELDCDEVLTTEKLSLAGSPYEMSLPPRLTQPSRINFRWLSATHDEQEMNDHPVASPICGWLLPNNLDNSLMLYNGEGTALGSINQEAKWQPAPGSDKPIALTEINPHLRKMVQYLLARGKSFLKDFISAIDNALENIEPENFAQHQDIALLMGRPIALVRASVNLELQGLPAIHQGWNAFRQDLGRNRRDTNDFDFVQFPIRIGEYKQFNDGLVGYWKEYGDEYEGNLFYAPQSDQIEDDHIKTHADDPMTICQTVTAPPQLLTMLLDPRGSVHVTSGILPAKAISIPPDQYAGALKAIEITFLSTPILTGVGKLRLPLPAEPGFRWSWLQKQKGGWSEISTSGIVRKQTVLAAFDDGEAVWNSLLTNGWVVRVDDTKATISLKEKRTGADLGSELAAQLTAIENLLDQAQLGAVNPGAVFPGPQKILEGWLKLSNAPSTGERD